VSRQVANALEKKFDKHERQTSVSWKDPRGVLVITDRSIDLHTPAQHDYSYAMMVSDLVKMNGKREVALPKKKEEAKGDSNVRMHKLDESDKFWKRFKNRHWAETMLKLGEEVDKFSKENDDFIKLNQGQDMDVG